MKPDPKKEKMGHRSDGCCCRFLEVLLLPLLTAAAVLPAHHCCCRSCSPLLLLPYAAAAAYRLSWPEQEISRKRGRKREGLGGILRGKEGNTVG